MRFFHGQDQRGACNGAAVQKKSYSSFGYQKAVKSRHFAGYSPLFRSAEIAPDLLAGLTRSRLDLARSNSYQLVSITSDLLASRTSYTYNMISTYLTGRLEANT
jgi:hypothetical protein